MQVHFCRRRAALVTAYAAAGSAGAAVSETATVCAGGGGGSAATVAATASPVKKGSAEDIFGGLDALHAADADDGAWREMVLVEPLTTATVEAAEWHGLSLPTMDVMAERTPSHDGYPVLVYMGDPATGAPCITTMHVPGLLEARTDGAAQAAVQTAAEASGLHVLDAPWEWAIVSASEARTGVLPRITRLSGAVFPLCDVAKCLLAPGAMQQLAVFPVGRPAKRALVARDAAAVVFADDA
jgi:hypothetical protein